VVNSIHYEIILYWSKEDQAFIAEVPELPSCPADGATYQEALANVEVIIREWVETARELGRPIPEPRGRLMYARPRLYRTQSALLSAGRGFCCASMAKSASSAAL
jgi:predicted RNase H-like HicB family nuclease